MSVLGSGGELRVKLVMEGDQFFFTTTKARSELGAVEAAFDRAGSQVKKFEGVTSNATRGFQNTVITLGALRFAMMDIKDVFIDIPTHIAKTAGEFERMQALMEGLSKSTDDATKKLEAARDVGTIITTAKNAPFDVKALSDAYVKFKAAGLDPVSGGFNTLVNGVAKFGGSSETLKRAAVAIQQMSGKGVISMEELRQQLGEAIPNAMQLMADGMGMSVAELTAKVSKGIVTSKTALARMFAQMEIDSAGAAEKMMTTFPGALERLKTEFQLFEKTIAGQGMMTSITLAMKGLTDFMASEEGTKLAKDIGNGLRDAIQAAIAFGKALYDNAAAIKMVAEAMLGLYAGGKLAAIGKNFLAEARENRARLEAEAEARRKIARNQYREENIARARQIAENLRYLKEQQKNDRIPAQIRELETEKLRKHYAEQDRVVKEANDRLKALAVERANLLTKPVERIAAIDPGPASPGGRGFSNQPAPGLPTNLSQNRFRLASTLPFNAIEEASNAALVKKANEDLVAAREKQIKSIDQTIESTRNAIAAATAEKQVLNSRTKEIEATSNQHAKLKAQMDASNNALRDSIRLNNQKIRALDGVAGAAIRLGSGIKEMGKSIGSSMLFGVAFTLALNGIMLLWDKVTDSARRAQRAQEAALRLKFGGVTEQDQADRTLDLAEASQEVQEKQKLNEKAQAYLGARRARAGATEMSPEVIKAREIYEKSVQDLNDARARLAEAQRRYNDTEKQINISQAEANASGYMGKVENEIRTKTQEEAARLNELQLKVKAMIADAEKRGAPKAEVDKLTKRLQDNRTVLAEMWLKGFTEALERAKVDPSISALERNSILTQLSDRIKNETEKIDTLNKERLTQASTKPGEGNDKSIPDRDRESPFQKAMQAIELSLIRQKGKIEIAADGLITSAEIARAARDEVEQLVKNDGLDQFVNPGNLKDNSRRKPTQDEQDTYFKKLVEQKEIDYAKKMIAEVAKLTTEAGLAEAAIDKIFAGDTAKGEGENGTVQQVDLLRKRLQNMREPIERALKETGSSLNFDQFLDQAVKNFRGDSLRNLADQFKALSRENEQLGQQEEQNDFQRQRRITENRIEEERRRLEVYKQSLMDKGPLSEADLARIKQVETQITQLSVNLSNQLSRQFRTPVQQMVDEWRNGFRQVQQAMVTFSNGLVDRLVDTKFRLTKNDVKDLAGTFFKDVAKTKFKDVLGNMTSSRNPDGSEKPGFLNGITNQLNEFLGLKQNDIGAKIINGAMLVTNADPYDMGKTGTDGATRIKDTAISMWDKGREWMEKMKLYSSTFLDEFKGNLGNLFNAVSRIFTSGSGEGGGGLIDALGKMFSNYSGSRGMTGDESGGNFTAKMNEAVANGWTPPTSEFANGGIMTSYGSLPLRKYANGGIARRPQLALFGEGKRPEAYVPLPDGRTIPVTMAGAQQQGAAMPSVSVNVINNSGTPVNAQQQGSPRFDGRQMVLDVVLSGMNEPGNFRDNMRSAVGGR